VIMTADIISVIRPLKDSSEKSGNLNTSKLQSMECIDFWELGFCFKAEVR